MTEVSVRLAGPADTAELERLAETDGRALPPAPHLIARRGGVASAALSLSTGAIVADPFRRTAELQELLLAYAGGVRVDPDSIPAEIERHGARGPRTPHTPRARLAA
jgi:hypothetical protein